MARRIESYMLAGPAGRLEALLEEPEDAEPTEACLVCHPHPKGGGTMHNKVVYRIARGLRKTGRVVLRFNFRGVGSSDGEYASGVGEVEDARAALEWLRTKYPALPYSLAGFSFGSRVILKLGCSLGNSGAPALPERLLAVGMPTVRETFPFLETCALPKIFISSTHDEYAPYAELESWFANFAEPKRLVWIEAADHFFKDALDPLEAAVEASALSPQG